MPQRGAESAIEPEIQTLIFQPLAGHKHVEKFDVSANTVDRLIRDEGLPVIRLGGTVRVCAGAALGWTGNSGITPGKAASAMIAIAKVYHP
jgi:hypothetical protein